MLVLLNKDKLSQIIKTAYSAGVFSAGWELQV